MRIIPTGRMTQIRASLPKTKVIKMRSGSSAGEVALSPKPIPLKIKTGRIAQTHEWKAKVN